MADTTPPSNFPIRPLRPLGIIQQPTNRLSLVRIGSTRSMDEVPTFRSLAASSRETSATVRSPPPIGGGDLRWPSARLAILAPTMARCVSLPHRYIPRYISVTFSAAATGAAWSWACERFRQRYRLGANALRGITMRYQVVTLRSARPLPSLPTSSAPHLRRLQPELINPPKRTVLSLAKSSPSDCHNITFLAPRLQNLPPPL